MSSVESCPFPQLSYTHNTQSQYRRLPKTDRKYMARPFSHFPKRLSISSWQFPSEASEMLDVFAPGNNTGVYRDRCLLGRIARQARGERVDSVELWGRYLQPWTLARTATARPKCHCPLKWWGHVCYRHKLNGVR